MPVKLLPLIVTAVPATAVVGLKELTVGLCIKLNPGIELLPPAVVIEIFPLVPLPNVATISLSEFTTNELAIVPPKLTELAPVK